MLEINRDNFRIPKGRRKAADLYAHAMGLRRAAFDLSISTLASSLTGTRFDDDATYIFLRTYTDESARATGRGAKNGSTYCLFGWTLIDSMASNFPQQDLRPALEGTICATPCPQPLISTLLLWDTSLDSAGIHGARRSLNALREPSG
jgi:hypothetical protein